MTHIDKVREALTVAQAVLVRYNPSSGTAVQCKDAALALSAHEAEVKEREKDVAELVAIAEKFATGAVGHADFDRLTAAIAKVKP